ncbi:phosphoribosylformylglycinamidine cyclo-ligase, chloroplastic/mitochondrial-like [Solanum stenotomum]|uniref:phosphoribosylformylglycinamidine cyclo-ligase, chloroplastic/mitochondrial-like n=1 Tax=Solanum stenotomum TaxID=172797 RepID=UPI0020D13343|nr:phosphoribosylformylglycinamidine cyclo-ligase, chloroplastic/mitochondrial-like [Solanum stenotomum]
MATANLQLYRCTAASPVYGLKRRSFCVPKLLPICKERSITSKKLLPLCKERNITCSGIWGVEGLYTLGDAYFVSAPACEGAKFKLAVQTGIYDTIGRDLVAISVNGIVTSGAKPIFFHDFFATKHLKLDLADKVTQGIKYGCQQSDCHHLEFQMREIPNLCDGDCDLCGIAVGIMKKDSVIDGKSINAGDVLIGLPSNGVHSYGFSLVTSVLDKSGFSLKDQLPGESITLGEALIAPTAIYVKQVLDIISKGGVKGIAHITGGLFTHNDIFNDNIPRVFPKGVGALIYEGSWTIPPVFKWIQEAGSIENAEMMQTFDMGIGMVLVVSPEAADRILGEVHKTSIAYRIGEVVKGDGVRWSSEDINISMSRSIQE